MSDGDWKMILYGGPKRLVRHILQWTTEMAKGLKMLAWWMHAYEREARERGCYIALQT